MFGVNIGFDDGLVAKRADRTFGHDVAAETGGEARHNQPPNGVGES